MPKQGTLASLGPIFQIAFVARDIDPLIEYWSKVIGAGPFFKFDSLRLNRTFFRGQPQEMVIDAVIGYWDAIQIEFIRPHSDNPSVYSEWLDSGKTGVHHFAIQVEDIALARRSIEALGLDIAQESIAYNGEPFFYVATDGPYFEVLAFDEGMKQFFGSIRDAHRDWDGSDPLRLVPSAEASRGAQRSQP